MKTTVEQAFGQIFKVIDGLNEDSTKSDLQEAITTIDRWISKAMQDQGLEVPVVN